MDQVYRRRRMVFAGALLAVILFIGSAPFIFQPETIETPSDVLSEISDDTQLAREALSELEVKNRAPKTGYERDEFGSGWASIDGCDSRNLVLQDSLSEARIGDDSCTVLSGTLDDPYTGIMINFVRGRTTSGDVQVDHVVALNDAWQKGAQQLEFTDRVIFANDPLNLLAVDGPANQ